MESNIVAHRCPPVDRRYVKAFIDFPKPLVAVVNGPAVGISVTVMGMFDLVYATESVCARTRKHARTHAANE